MTSNNKSTSQDLLKEISEKLLNALTHQGAITSSLNSSSQNDIWLNVEELCNYLPEHPCRNTVYIWKSKRLIPFHKRSKHLYFLKSEIDEWLRNSRHATYQELVEKTSKTFKNRGAL